MSQTDTINAALLAERTEQLLRQAWGSSLQVQSLEPLSAPRARSLLMRVRLAGGPEGIRSVIVKGARRGSYDPSSAGSIPARALFREWAAQQFLAKRADTSFYCPTFYAGDVANGLIAFEDLGDTPDLAEVLLNDGPAAAERALVQLAEALGRIHAATTGRQAEYQAIRDALGPGDEQQHRAPAQHLLYAIPVLQAFWDGLGMQATAGFEQDVQAVIDTLSEPGPFLAFTHGDVCPDNCRLAGGGLRLIDFEYSGYRHALLDALFARMGFPTSWCSGAIPNDVLQRVEAAYRRQLAAGCPEAADEQAWNKGYVAACAFWLLENLNGHLRTAVLEDSHLGTTTWRHRLIGRLRAFVDVAGRSGSLPALTDSAARLLSHLGSQWKVELEEFDAFARPLHCSPQQVRRFVEGVLAGRVEGVKKVLSLKPSLANARAADPRRSPVLHLAIRSGNVQMVRALLEGGADAARRDRMNVSALEAAHQRGSDIAMVEALLAMGAKADVLTAFLMGNLDLARQLLEEDLSRAWQKVGRGTVLHELACRPGLTAEAVRLLADCGADVNAAGAGGATPLHLAAWAGLEENVRVLLECGADRTATDEAGRTAVEVARHFGHEGCVRALVRTGR